MKPFTNYTCTIHAVAGSVGSKSDPITVTTDQQGWHLVQKSNNLMSNVSAPNPPVVLSFTAIDSESVNVTWRAPTQPNGVLISYTITYTIDDKSNKRNVTVPYEGNVSNWVFSTVCCNIIRCTYCEYQSAILLYCKSGNFWCRKFRL